MIRNTDLRLYDWVTILQSPGRPADWARCEQITGIGTDVVLAPNYPSSTAEPYPYCRVEPIKLTKEMLEQNGLLDKYHPMCRWDATDEEWYFYHDDAYGNINKAVTYVHELQNNLYDCGMTDIARTFKIYEK